MSAQDTALIIIDMQQGMAGDGLPARNNPEAEANLARLLACWRDAGLPVVHVRHISRTPGSVFFPGQQGVEFQARFLPLAGEHVVEKNVPDAFIQSGLERWLHVRGIGRVVLGGVSTNNSVECTARSGGNLGFQVDVAGDACFAFALRDLTGAQHSAELVHRMALANLHGEYATVRNTDELLASVPPPKK